MALAAREREYTAALEAAMAEQREAAAAREVEEAAARRAAGAAAREALDRQLQERSQLQHVARVGTCAAGGRLLFWQARLSRWCTGSSALDPPFFYPHCSVPLLYVRVPHPLQEEFERERAMVDAVVRRIEEEEAAAADAARRRQRDAQADIQRFLVQQQELRKRCGQLDSRDRAGGLEMYQSCAMPLVPCTQGCALPACPAHTLCHRSGGRLIQPAWPASCMSPRLQMRRSAPAPSAGSARPRPPRSAASRSSCGGGGSGRPPTQPGRPPSAKPRTGGPLCLAWLPAGNSNGTSAGGWDEWPRGRLLAGHSLPVCLSAELALPVSVHSLGLGSFLSPHIH